MPSQGSPFNPAFPSPEAQLTPEKILRGVMFDKFTEKDGVFTYSSNDPTRKLVVLNLSSGFVPEYGTLYDVEVIRDTKPESSKEGKLIVKIFDQSAAKNNKSAEAPLKPKVKKQEMPLPIEVDEKVGQVFILETALPYNASAQPELIAAKMKKFRYFCLDADTLENVEKVATAMELVEPCLLEGETSTTKTSGIEFAAAVTGNEILRLNLNGQANTSELVGKFVPNDGQLQIAFEEAVRNFELLSEESRAILTRANADGRGLSLIESQKIAEREKIKISDWRWQDGLDVRAKKEGKWLILDEMNLAEPQILERINSQLEKNPSITLSENGGLEIRKLDEAEMALFKEGKLPGVYPLHENFRIFATINPAENAGRAPMSPAFKNRWTSYKYCKNPTKESYAQMMELMVYGEQPEVVMHGQKYRAQKIEPLLTTLSELSGLRGFLPKLARFHAALEEMARKREIGKDKKEKYIFTRRDLIEFVEYLERKTFVDRRTGARLSVKDAPKKVILQAIQYYYLDKIADADDLLKVKDQLDAIGISEAKWKHEFNKPQVAPPDVVAPNVAPPDATNVVLPPGAVGPSPGLHMPQGPNILPDKVEVKRFTDFIGGVIERTEEITREGLRVGDKLKLRDGVYFLVLTEIRNARTLEIAGFQADGKVIVQIDGDKVVVDSVATLRNIYEILPGAPEIIGKQERFKSIHRDIIFVSDGRQKVGSYRIGDNLKVKGGLTGFSIDGKNLLEKAHTIDVGGFTSDGLMIVVPDGNKDATLKVTLESVDDNFEVISATKAKKGFGEKFIDMRGHVFLADTSIRELDGYRVGDALKLNKNGELTATAGLRNARTLELAGFTSDGKFIIVADGIISSVYVFTNKSSLENMLEQVLGKGAVNPLFGAKETFKNSDGDKLESNGLKENYGYHVGDILKTRKDFILNPRFLLMLKSPSSTLPFEIERAQNLSVGGFFGTGIIIVPDNNKNAVFNLSPGFVEDIFERVLAGPNAGKGEKYLRVDKNDIVLGEVRRDKRLGLYGFKVGDYLRVKGSSTGIPTLNKARYLRVAGFTPQDEIIVSLKPGINDEVYVIEKNDSGIYLQTVPSGTVNNEKSEQF